MFHRPSIRVPNPLSPLGRREWKVGLWYHGWRPLQHAARLHRLTISRSAQVVAVTGTFGKTTTTRTVRAALGLGDPLRTHYGQNGLGILAVELFRQATLGRTAVIEVGIGGPGRMSAYARALRPSVAVVTSLGSEHLRAFAGPDALRREKARLVRALPSDGVAVLNGDDPRILSMSDETPARVVSFGLEPSNDVFASEIELDWPHGTRLEVEAAGRTLRLRTRFLGLTMVPPVLAAVATAVALGRDLDRAAAALSALPPTLGRVQPVPLPAGAMALRDDRKAALETIHAALDLLKEIPARRRIVVLGDISDPPDPVESRYAEVGRHAAGVADRILVIGVEAPFEGYRAGALSAGLGSEAISFAPSVAEAVELLPALGEGDVLLVKGRRKEKLTRLLLALSGERVGCRVPECELLEFCDRCSLLRREQQRW